MTAIQILKVVALVFVTIIAAIVALLAVWS